MREIYSGAQNVCIWLGPEANDSNLAISFLTSTLKLLRDNNETDIENYGSLLGTGVPAQTSKEWKAVFALLHRAWFGRMWVVQEVAAAVIAKIVCGQAEMPWTVFVDMTHRVARARMYWTGIVPAAHWRLANIVMIKDQFDEHDNVPIAEALTGSKVFQATDPRD